MGIRHSRPLEACDRRLRPFGTAERFPLTERLHCPALKSAEPITSTLSLGHGKSALSVLPTNRNNGPMKVEALEENVGDEYCQPFPDDGSRFLLTRAFFPARASRRSLRRPLQPSAARGRLAQPPKREK